MCHGGGVKEQHLRVAKSRFHKKAISCNRWRKALISRGAEQRHGYFRQRRVENTLIKFVSNRVDKSNFLGLILA